MAYHVDMLAVGDRVSRFPSVGEPDHDCDPVLDELATASTTARDALNGDGMERLAVEALESGTVFVILLRWDRSARAFLDRLHGCGSAIVPVLVSDKVPAGELPDDLRVVTPEAILAGGDLPL